MEVPMQTYALNMAVVAKAKRVREIVRHVRAAGVPQENATRIILELTQSTGDRIPLLSNLLGRFGVQGFTTRLEKLVVKVFAEKATEPTQPKAPEPSELILNLVASVLARHMRDVATIRADLGSRVSQISAILESASALGIEFRAEVLADVQHLARALDAADRILHTIECEDCRASFIATTEQTEAEENPAEPPIVINSVVPKTVN